jgi:hypothetical protein
MATDERKRKPLPEHWYKIYVGECPVCGRDQGSRERVYGKPPTHRKDRYVYLPDSQTYDGCLERQ